ncbi:TonB-dependent receptor [Phenylobacterium sp.]|uniref:TonB-dependent receptor n=1 Tax=Phenylobacterium sp. TaxID=1871053 RepID=UPI0025DBC4FB|nr:TonB-dependent receptor [Phenylobacterium sp.]
MKRNLSHRAGMLATGVAALLGGAALPAMAWAQGQPDKNALEEVVVTAEKRAEGLQNIPIAITAVTAATLEKAGIREVGDLVQLTPSLQFGTKSTNVFIAMRGIGQAGQDIGSQSGVTVSLDGVPLLNHFMMNPSFMDIERVEVLRGPQGTIAGRNATGGAINIYSKGPARDDDGSLVFTAGNRSRLGLKGHVNKVFSDQLAGRLAFQREEAKGWLKNDFIGKRNDDTDVAQVRGQLLFTPTEAFSVRALLEYTKDRSDPGFSQILRRADPARPTVPELPTYAFPRNDPKNLTFYFNEPNHRDVEDVRATAVATWNIAPNVTLTSTTGFIDHDIDLTDLDVDATPANSSRFDLIGLYAKQVTQEFTLTADLSERADLVAGAFYMRGDSSEPLYLSLATFKNYLVYLPEETLKSYAAYAQFRYQITDQLRATVGGRYTTDDKSYQMDSSVGGAPRLSSDSGKFSAFTPRVVLDYTPTDDTLIYASVSRGFKSGGFNTLGDVSLPVNRFNPEYVWNYEAGLKAMMFDRKLRMGLTGFYADYTNLQQTVFRLNDATQVRFPRVENSTAAKIKGVEFEAEANPVRGVRLTGAVTYLDAKFGFFCNNDPLYPTAPTSPSCIGATRDGAPLPAGAVQLRGNSLTQAPEWQYNVSAQYTLPVSDTVNLTGRADYKWQSRTYFDIYNNRQNSQGAYGLLNLSVEVAAQDRAWSVLAWVRNAADKRYVSQGSAGSGANAAVTGSMGMPRMFGVTLSRYFQ